MTHKVPPSERISKELFDALDGSREADDLVNEIMRLGMQTIIQKHVEGEQADHLGRGRYERGDKLRGYRNGYYEKVFKTMAGNVPIDVPRVRDSDEPFESQLLARLGVLEQRVADMAIEMYVRGLSTRDIEETLIDEHGEPMLSRSSTSRLTDELYAEYEGFAERDLSGYDVVYLFVDGVYEAVRSYTNNQAILAAWAICADERKVLLHLEAAASESTDAWSDFLEDMGRRGLRQPLYVVSDGCNGLKAAIARHFPHSDRGRCIVHKLRNLANKLPQDARKEVLSQVKGVYYAPDRETADLLAERFLESYAETYPAMVKCFCDDLEACLVHLKYPLGHRKYIRSTNLLERAFVEEKRRTKVIPQHVNERGAMKLVYGTLIRASRRWQNVSMPSLVLAQLRNIRNIMQPQSEQTETISFRAAA